MEENNIADIAKAVFSGEPRVANSVILGLEDCAPPGASPEKQAQILSEVLMLMFLEGIKVCYGDDANPASLTEQQIEKLSEYVRSYGFSIIVRSDELDSPPLVPTTPRSKLKDFHERFYDFERGLWHEVAFDWAPVHNPRPQAGDSMISIDYN
jgi:hypothetical protein